MVSEKATLVNPQGLHMRPAGLFASTMGKYACDVTVVTPEKEVNGKSPMALMAAGIPAAPRSRSSATALTRPRLWLLPSSSSRAVLASRTQTGRMLNN